MFAAARFNEHAVTQYIDHIRLHHVKPIDSGNAWVWSTQPLPHKHSTPICLFIRPKQKIGLFPVGNASKRRLGRPEWNFFWILFFGSSIVVVLMDKSTYTCTLYIHHGKGQCQSWLTHYSCTACGVFLFSYILRNQAYSSSPSSSVILARIDPEGFRADSWESLLPCRCFDCGIRLRFDWVMTRWVHLHTWHCHRLYTFGTKKKFQNLGKSGPVGRPETRSLFVLALFILFYFIHW